MLTNYVFLGEKYSTRKDHFEALVDVLFNVAHTHSPKSRKILMARISWRSFPVKIKNSKTISFNIAEISQMFNFLYNSDLKKGQTCRASNQETSYFWKLQNCGMCSYEIFL